MCSNIMFGMESLCSLVHLDPNAASESKYNFSETTTDNQIDEEI